MSDNDPDRRTPRPKNSWGIETSALTGATPAPKPQETPDLSPATRPTPEPDTARDDARENDDPREADPAQQKPEAATRRPRRGKKRRALLIVLVLIALVLIGWDVWARVTPTTASDPTITPNTSAANSGTVTAAEIAAAVRYETLTLSKSDSRAWCPLTIRPATCVKSIGVTPAPGLNSPVSVVKSAVVPAGGVTGNSSAIAGTKAGAPGAIGVVVSSVTGDNTTAQLALVLLRPSDRKVIGEVPVLSAAQQQQSVAQLGASVLSNPDSNSAVMW